MYTLVAENIDGEKLELSHNNNYSVIGVTGLTPAPANVNTAVMGNFDGEKFASSRVSMRNIVITLKLERDIETSRTALYKFFRPKHWCRLYFKNAARDVYIDGYVETFEGDLFVNDERMQISVVCPQPYFLLAAKTVDGISRTNALFEFPFSIAAEGIPFSEINESRTANVLNEGDVEIGLIIELTAIGGTVTGPTIYNADTRESFELPNTTLIGNDIVRINTNRGEKKIERIRDGVVTNIISDITTQVDWFQLSPGDNVFTFSCDGGEQFLQLNFSINEKYQGV